MWLVALLVLLVAVGAIGGAVLTLLLLERAHGLDPQMAAFRARQELGEIERQTIQRLMAVELGARRAGAAAPRPPVSSDIVEGTAVDVEPRP